MGKSFLSDIQKKDESGKDTRNGNPPPPSVIQNQVKSREDRLTYFKETMLHPDHYDLFDKFYSSLFPDEQVAFRNMIDLAKEKGLDTRFSIHRK